jgi:signal transduction histidine kinase
VAAACTLVGLALGGQALWLIVLADEIPLNRGVAYAAMLALACVALIAAARALLGAAQAAPDAATRPRSVWLRTAVSGSTLVAGLAVLGGLTYWLGRDLVENSVRQRLEAVATLNVSLIESWAEDTRNDIDIWSRGPVFVRALTRPGNGAALAANGGASQRQDLRRLARTWNYSAVTVRDPATGARWLTTSDDPDSLAERQQALALAAQSTGTRKPVVDLASTNSPAGSPVQLSFFRPVSLPDDARQALVQVEVALDDSPLRRALPGPQDARAVDLLVVQRDADAVLIVSDSRSQASRLPLPRLAIDAGSVWATIQRAGGTGFARGVDAGGQPVLAFARPVAGTSWMLAALTGEEAVLGELNRVFLLAMAMADALLVIGIWWWMLYRRQAARESRMQRERTRHAEQVAELSRRVVSTQEQERNRLAMELHDRTAANLATINLNLKCIARTIPNTGRDGPDLLQESNALLADTIVSIREFCADLRPALLSYAGLTAALRAAATQFELRTGIRTELDDRDFAVSCHADLETGLFRIAQEALLNCAKHSAASQVRLEIALRDGLLQLGIADNGVGFDPQSLGRGADGVGHGLLYMRDRAALAGGTLTVESFPGGGTRIRFVMPWSTPQLGG